MIAGGDGRAMLEGLRVIDMTSVVFGPYCTQILADFGAEVIKVEAPEGDDTRRWGPPWIEVEGDRSAAYFHGCNRGKKSVTADFRTPAGLELTSDGFLFGPPLQAGVFDVAFVARAGGEEARRARRRNCRGWARFRRSSERGGSRWCLWGGRSGRP